MGSSSSKPDPFPSTVCVHEEKWVQLQPFLLQRGYKLRPRYNPDWKPSWTGPLKFNVRHRNHEDFSHNKELATIDATRLSDNTRVVLKHVFTATDEIPIFRYLTSESLRSDTRNKTVPLLDVIILPWTDEIALLVMPMLMQFDRLPFRFLSEVCEALEQLLQGLVFMYEHKIAHRDACWRNFMMDISRVVPTGYHFARWMTEDGIRKELRWVPRKSVAPVRYHIIDFGPVGQDRTVPEASLGVPYDAFKFDIYQLGNVIVTLLDIYEDLSSLKPLADAMTRRDPDQRPSATEAYELLVDTILNLSEDQLNHQRIWKKRTPAELRHRVEFCNENPLEYY